MSVIQFRLAARTDAAGKYNPSAPLEGNEDNMFVDADLSKGKLGEFTRDEVVRLSDKGCLMVVADGMGGMNAGEVASAIAIKTVTEYFARERLTDSIIKDSRSRMRYMEEVVVAADTAIKKDSTSNPEHEGMGSTIIMAWLCGDEICLTWCGDSRAYLFRPNQGFKQVSKDHSYVQGLVDEGKITEIEAFDHPYGNVIMRSLGDPEKKAKPESKCFKVYQGDIFMLCSDGLSGVLRDHKTFNANGERLDTENLEDIIATHRNSMTECRDCLFEAAQRNDWYDNVTAILCEILKADSIASSSKIPSSPNSSVSSRSRDFTYRKKNLLYIFIALIAFGLGLILALRLTNNDSNPKEKNTVTTANNDSLQKAEPQLEQSLDKIVRTEESTKTAITKEEKKEVVDKKVEPKRKEPNSDKTIEVKTNSKDEKPDPVITINEEEVGAGQEHHMENKPNLKEVTENSNSEKTVVFGENVLKPTTNQGGLSKSNEQLVRERETLPKAQKQVLSEEDLYKKIISKNGSIEDCCVYAETYGKKNKNHLTEVKKKFYSFYQLKSGQAIKTKEGCEQFLKEHDEIMDRMKFTSKEKENYDNFKEQVNKKWLLYNASK